MLTKRQTNSYLEQEIGSSDRILFEALERFFVNFSNPYVLIFLHYQ